MLKNISILLVLTSITFFACKTTSDRQALRDEVMDVHNEMMVHFKPIQKAQKDIMAIMMDAENPLDNSQSMEYGKAYTLLQNAEKVMRDWMTQWTEPTEEMTDEAAMAYLKDQQKKVVAMKRIMEKNIEVAKKTFDF